MKKFGYPDPSAPTPAEDDELMQIWAEYQRELRVSEKAAALRVPDYLKHGGKPGQPGAMGTEVAAAYYQGRLDQAAHDEKMFGQLSESFHAVAG